MARAGDEGIFQIAVLRTVCPGGRAGRGPVTAFRATTARDG
ncbi:hypothetical protein Aros01_02169 [Streptosporangium roseum]|uniref:Uncharacterized protein n=1 Tax=Streptosporangium roseum (strain ATCC 12428 / DSM 43021 / JCM 3005 / KCTC 9067 / NCIMB 10171 / NRRL 2505 / NI 9100) TaxID=479432 RepID=D2B6B6_STRRD|nr:hypothetical protein Sros_0815 [Streptosporangium roseum DSM 43021]